MRFYLVILATLILPTGVGVASAEGLPSLQKATEIVQAATVTVRVVTTASRGDRPATVDEDLAVGEDEAPSVTVFSGVSIGQSLVVAPLYSATDARVRITMAGGEQAEAKPLVFDEYSGLTLLEMDRQDVPGLELADELPKEGSWVLSAAAWGVEKPIVSLGIVSGVDRTLRGATYPPLLQCDLRTAETSSGAAIVDHQGRLIGIIVAADVPSNHRGWTYAVPVRHVRRLLRARADNADGRGVVVLQRRRPTVGMVLDGQGDAVVVRRVTKGSPAERAGIRPGDAILGADGIKIRSVYQAVRPTLYKQPGDTITFLVQQVDGVRLIEVVLGGGVVLPGAGAIDLTELFQPKVIVGPAAGGDLASRIRRDSGQAFDRLDDPPSAVPTARQLLEKALDRYRSVIVYQQEQLRRNQSERAETEAQIESLRTQIELLEKMLDEAERPASR